MITCKCIEKFRDKNGNIKGYRLQDQQGKCLDVKPDQLKMAIFSQQLDVINLKLTADSKLIDKEVDIITELEQIDAYNQSPKAIADRWSKYLKLLAHFNKRVYQLNEKFNIKNECIETFNGINIYNVISINKKLYSRKTNIKLHGSYNVYYEVFVRKHGGDFAVLDIELYTKAPNSDYKGFNWLQLLYADYIRDTENVYESEFMLHYKATPENLVNFGGGDDEDTIRKERQDLVARVIYAEVLDNYQEVMRLTEKALIEEYKNKCKKFQIN